MGLLKRHIGIAFIASYIMFVAFSYYSIETGIPIYSVLACIGFGLSFIVSIMLLRQRGSSLWWLLLFPSIIFPIVVVLSKNSKGVKV